MGVLVVVGEAAGAAVVWASEGLEPACRQPRRWAQEACYNAQRRPAVCRQVAPVWTRCPARVWVAVEGMRVWASRQTASDPGWATTVGNEG